MMLPAEVKLIIFAGTVLLAGIIPLSASSRADKEIDFFAGVILLQSTTALSVEEKTLKFRELQRITGITVNHAKKLLDGYRDRPEEWQRLSNAIVQLIDLLKPTTAAPADGPKQKNIP